MIYAIGIEFIGTNYKGWQRQSHDDNTIQAHLETAFSKIAILTLKLLPLGERMQVYTQAI